MLLSYFDNVNAQSNAIFYGGAGDGWSTMNYLPTVATVNLGGSGDGWSTANYQQMIVSINQGGTGDGWSFSNYLQTTMPLNKGGAGDGWSTEHSIPFLNAGLNKGGMGDGWASTYTAVLPLPIIFLSFDAAKGDHVALLNWKMADDKDVVYFDVERSSNAVDFKKIGVANQDDNVKMNYNFTDRLPLQGQNYYRLKIMNKDGKTSYTGTRVVNFEGNIASIIKVFPNPATNLLNVELPEDFTGMNTAVNVYNSNGAMVIQMKMLDLQNRKIEINTSILAAGNYFVHIATDNKTATAKFTVLAR